MSDLREAMARAIAVGLGDDFDNAFATKSEWNAARGEKGGRYRDINEPMKSDYEDAADAALAAIEAAGWQCVPRAADDETLDTIAAQFSEYADSLPSRTIARRAWAGALITAPKP